MPAITTTIRPTAQGFHDNYAAGGAYSKPTAVSDQNDATYVEPSAASYESYLLEDIPVPGGSLVSQVFVQARFDVGASGGEFKIMCRLNGLESETLLNNFAMTGTVLTQGAFFTTKPGGGSWTIFDVNAMEVGVYLNWTVDIPKLVDIWAIPTYNPIPGELEHIRILATQRLLMNRQARSLVRQSAPFPLADVELLTLVPWSHTNGPSPLGDGWGEKSWQRRSTVLLASNLDLNTMTVDLVAQDFRGLLVMLYDCGRTLISSNSFANGIGRIYVGTRTYNRDSKAYVVDPSDLIVREVAYDVEQLAADESDSSHTSIGGAGGQLLEDAATNELTRSSFISGTTGLTLAGTGVNGSAIAVDTSDLLFDETITPNRLKFTAGNPHASELSAAWAATASWAANTVGKLSIDYKNGGLHSLVWRLVRNVDGRYFVNSNGTWQVAPLDNALNLPLGGVRFVSSLIDVGGSATTLTLTIAMPSGGTASRLSYLYHVQLEKNRWATSRVITDSATATRAVSILSYTNDSGARNFPNACGTMQFEWTSLGIDANASTKTLYFLKLDYDADNWFRGFFDGATLEMKFQARVAGVTYTATKLLSAISRGTVYRVAFRWTSAEAEHDLSAGTISVFVDGSKGTDAVPGAMPTETSPSTLYIGNDGSSVTCNGLMRYIRITPVVLSNQEIGRSAPAIFGR